MVKEEPKESSQELEEVNLVDGDTKKVTKVRTRLSTVLKGRIVEFLKQNLDVFAWTHKDMSGIDNEVIEHKLNVDPTKKPVQQKRQVFAPKTKQSSYGRSRDAFDSWIHLRSLLSRVVGQHRHSQEVQWEMAHVCGFYRSQLSLP